MSAVLVSKTPQSVYDELNSLDWSITDRNVATMDLHGHSVEVVKKEALRFLSLYALQNARFACPFLIDEYWHQMILNTPVYAETVPIFGRFIHHIQNDGTVAFANHYHESLWKTVQVYEDTFGEPNLSIWGLEKKSEGVNA